jgi:hypothetical protein
MQNLAWASVLSLEELDAVPAEDLAATELANAVFP